MSAIPPEQSNGGFRNLCRDHAKNGVMSLVRPSVRHLIFPYTFGPRELKFGSDNPQKDGSKVTNQIFDFFV